MRAAIISAQRCGGLFLAGCLSNHPEIHCPREEPFRRESIWQAKLKLGPWHLLDFVLSEPYYAVSMCRLTYDQAFHPEIASYIAKQQVRILHLVREPLPTVTSTLLAKQEMKRGIPRHSFDDTFVDDETLDVGPEEVLRRIKHLLGQRKRFLEMYQGQRMLLVRYEGMTWMDGAHLSATETARIRAFLEVQPWGLSAQNRKMHKRPSRDYYTRWAEIEPALKAAGWTC